MKYLPQNWEFVTLGDCCQIVSGSTPRRNKSEYWGGDIPWVTPKDLSKLSGPVLDDAPEKITKVGYESCSTTLMPKGAILFSSRAPIGHVAIAGRPMCTNQGFKSLVPNKKIHSAYLYWCMKNSASHVKALGSGTTFKEVSKGIVERFKIPLPPIAEQRRIAAILDKADGMRRDRKQAIQYTEELLRSAFLDMFGDPVINPKGWPEKALGDLLETIIDYRGKTPRKSESGIPLISAANIHKGRVDFNYEQYISEEDYADWTIRGFTQSGDILITTEAPVGEVAAYPASGTYQISRRIMALRPHKKSVLSSFLLHTMLTDNWSDRLKRVTRGSTVPRVLKPDILSQSIPCPSIDKQNEFNKFFLAHKHLQNLEESSPTYADDLFNSLLQRAFKGDL